MLLNNIILWKGRQQLMPKTSYTFSTQRHWVTFNHDIKRYKKMQYCIESLEIVCEPLSGEGPKYGTVMNGEYIFTQFADMKEFITYIRRNKKKDIVRLENEGFLTIMVIGSDGSTESESINIERIQREGLEEEEQAEVQKFSKNDIRNWVDGFNVFREDVEEAPKDEKEKRNEAIYITVDKVQHQINQERPIFEASIPNEVMLTKGFKLTVAFMFAERLVLGIRGREGERSVCYWCSYKACPNGDEFRVSAKHQLSIYIEDNCIVIMNDNNKNGRFFSNSNFDSLVGSECKVFVSLAPPEN